MVNTEYKVELRNSLKAQLCENQEFLDELEQKDNPSDNDRYTMNELRNEIYDLEGRINELYS
jgi:hypothetical protein